MGNDDVGMVADERARGYNIGINYIILRVISKPLCSLIISWLIRPFRDGNGILQAVRYIFFV